MKKLNKIVGELAIISPLIFLSIPFDLWSECLLIVALLFVYKTRYATNYHADKDAICIAMSYTAVIIGLIVSYLMPKQYLLLIMIYNIVAYISAKAGAMQEKAKKYELIAKPYSELVEFYKEQTAPKPFDPDNCTEAELVERCQALRFSETNIKLAIEFFIKKTKHSDLADILNVQEKTITTRKERMKKKLTTL